MRSHAYFPSRIDLDSLDVSPLLYRGLLQDEGQEVINFQGLALGRQQLRAEVACMQNWLEQQGLQSGDRVAVMLNNSVQHIALIYAVILSGLVWVPINTKLRGPGLQYILQHARPQVMVLEEEFTEVLAPYTSERLPQVLLQQIPVATMLSAPASLKLVQRLSSDTLCLIYTSGTTGAPKGVVFTHRMMRIATEAALMVANIKDGDRAFLWEPLCHIGGAQMLLVPFLVDASLLVVERFSASQFWSQWQQSRASHLHYLGGVLDILMQLPEEAKPDGASIATAWGAGVAANNWQTIQSRLGCELRECYGMTECSSFATLNASGKPGSIGKALPWIRLELLDEEDFPVTVGSAGQIVLSSDLEGVFLPHYLDNPEASAKALRNGKLCTGDMARQDEDGDLFFIGRASDSMRVRGENVSAWEVERVFAEHPAIEASAAMGIKSQIGEQEIYLFVKFKPEQHCDWQDLIGWAKPRMAAFQLPRYFASIERFDLTPSQRIQKHRLTPQLDRAWDRQTRA